MLKIQDLHAYYGKSHVLHGVNMTIAPGEIACLLGRNGAGRSTLIKAAVGLVEAEGSVRLRGAEILGRKAFEIAHLGLGYVPENRDIFPTLTVEQNLLLGAKGGRGSPRWSLDDMYAMFPVLQLRRTVAAGVLSGGEQQMLTLCRTLMGDPDLIMVDEPTEGLAPKIVAQVADFLLAVRAKGVAILLVEQKLAIALKISDTAFVMGHGTIVFEGKPTELMGNEYILKEWIRV